MFVRGTRYGLARLIVETRLDPEQKVLFCRGTGPFCGLLLYQNPIPPLWGTGTMPRIHQGGLHGWHGRSGHVAANATQSGVDRAIHGRVLAFAQGARGWAGWGPCVYPVSSLRTRPHYANAAQRSRATLGEVRTRVPGWEPGSTCGAALSEDGLHCSKWVAPSLRPKDPVCCLVERSRLLVHPAGRGSSEE